MVMLKRNDAVKFPPILDDLGVNLEKIEIANTAVQRYMDVTPAFPCDEMDLCVICGFFNESFNFGEMLFHLRVFTRIAHHDARARALREKFMNCELWLTRIKASNSGIGYHHCVPIYILTRHVPCVRTRHMPAQMSCALETSYRLVRTLMNVIKSQTKNSLVGVMRRLLGQHRSMKPLTSGNVDSINNAISNHSIDLHSRQNNAQVKAKHVRAKSEAYTKWQRRSINM